MKYSLLLVLFVAATFSAALASPRRTRVGKTEHPTTAAEEVTTIDQETVSPSTELPAQPVEEASEDKDPEPAKDLQEQNNDAEVTVSNVDDHEVVETVVTDAVEETVHVQTPDIAPVLQQSEPEEVEDTDVQKVHKQSPIEKDSKSFLNLFLNGMDHIKTAINELQAGVQTFFISSNADGAMADEAKS
ncbi:uncharacterized protein LOC125771204 [Anopheles funestus]|uniref:uncharacterized protein LOC125771204 n=1 Tax=Anopheles funestus TaxID=62324 RepID=UPI0020C69713|nr:uncharacterized protein LOC125771204 [Anopheles funestus]